MTSNFSKLLDSQDSDARNNIETSPEKQFTRTANYPIEALIRISNLFSSKEVSFTIKDFQYLSVFFGIISMSISEKDMIGHTVFLQKYSFFSLDN